MSSILVISSHAKVTGVWFTPPGSLFHTRCTSCHHIEENHNSPICPALKDKGYAFRHESCIYHDVYVWTVAVSVCLSVCLLSII